MADQPTGPLADTARTLGRAAGKIASAVSGRAPAEPQKENLWQAEYLGSGTFVFHKPPRKERKRRQQALKGPRRGMRK